MLIDGTVWRQDVATRACTGMCVFWRVPAVSIWRILRNAGIFKLSQYPCSTNLATFNYSEFNRETDFS